MDYSNSINNHFKRPLIIKSKSFIYDHGYKYFKKLLNHTEHFTCNYVNIYGESCNNKCLHISPFKMRQVFCEHHIKNYIHFIIKFNNFISSFIKFENDINMLFNQYYHSSKLNSEKSKIKILLKDILHFIQSNEECIIITQPIIDKLKKYCMKSISNMIFDTYEYREKINILNCYMYHNIIFRNIEKKQNSISELNILSLENNNTIGNIFKNSKIGDRNVINIIGKFI